MRSRSRSGTLASRLRTRCTQQCWRSEAGQHCSMALISPGAPSATISIGAPSPRAIRSRPSSSQSSWDSRIPSITARSTRPPAPGEPPLAGLGEAPGDQHALLGPVAADRQKNGVDEQRCDVDVVEVAALERFEALAQLGADPGRGRLGELAEPGLLA